jgi:hypothetical protein
MANQGAAGRPRYRIRGLVQAFRLRRVLPRINVVSKASLKFHRLYGIPVRQLRKSPQAFFTRIAVVGVVFQPYDFVSA